MRLSFAMPCPQRIPREVWRVPDQFGWFARRCARAAPGRIARQLSGNCNRRSSLFCGTRLRTGNDAGFKFLMKPKSILPLFCSQGRAMPHLFDCDVCEINATLRMLVDRHVSTLPFSCTIPHPSESTPTPQDRDQLSIASPESAPARLLQKSPSPRTRKQRRLPAIWRFPHSNGRAPSGRLKSGPSKIEGLV